MKSLEQFTGVSLGNSKSLGWFGFAADPPTLAHRAVVDAVLGSGLVEKVLVFPAGNVSYKEFAASEWQRAEMTELWKVAAGFGDEVVVSRFDLMEERAIYWYDLWQEITRRAPKVRHFFIVGSDQYLSVAGTWYRGEELLEQASFLVVPRKDFPLQEVAKKSILLKVPPIEGSSTVIRGGDLDRVDERVRAYILEQKLYR